MSLVSDAIGIALAIAIAGAPLTSSPVRVCADPNNLPFSDRAGRGFENKIAELIAKDLKRPLAYVWAPQRRGFIRNTLDAHACDVIVGASSGIGRLATTRPYYRSSYVFVTRQDRHLRLASFDDPRLRTLTIGIQLVGDDYENPPPAQALASRRLIDHVRGFMVYGDYLQRDPQRDIVDAVSDGRVDVAVVWGPVAGYYRTRVRAPLVLTSTTFSFDIAMAVRRDDRALQRALDAVVVRRGGEIRAILGAYGVPMR